MIQIMRDPAPSPDIVLMTVAGIGTISACPDGQAPSGAVACIGRLPSAEALASDG
jgi:hypothetical protein